MHFVRPVKKIHPYTEVFKKPHFSRRPGKKSFTKNRAHPICHHSGDRPADFLSTAPSPHPDGVMHKSYVYQFLKCIRSYMCLPVSPTLALSLFALRGTIFASPYIFLHLCLSLSLVAIALALLVLVFLSLSLPLLLFAVLSMCVCVCVSLSPATLYFFELVRNKQN